MADNIVWIGVGNSITLFLDDRVQLTRDEVMAKLAERGIETRPFFYPMHVLPIYNHLSQPKGYPVADALASRGINLPSSAKLTREDVQYVSESLIQILQ